MWVLKRAFVDFFLEFGHTQSKGSFIILQENQGFFFRLSGIKFSKYFYEIFILDLPPIWEILERTGAFLLQIIDSIANKCQIIF